jgi:signal transduction histidine kinase
MKGLRSFLKRHILWVGFLAVIVPLLSLLGLQYWFLLRLEKTSSLADKVWMKNYLADVSKEVKFHYRNSAEQTLSTRAYALTPENLQDARHLYGKCDVEIAKRLFLVIFNDKGEAQTIFYQPDTKLRVTNPSAEEARAVNFVAAPVKLLREDTSAAHSSMLSLDDHDMENLILFKLISDDAQRVVGVTGMILDASYFQNIYLPQAISSSLPKFFPDDQEDVIVAVYDDKGARVMSTQPAKGQDDEIWTSLPYFSDWKVGIRSRNMTPEQWAHWNFNINLTLSILLTAALLGGITLALRTASREMRLSQMKTDFVSNVSHELRTPLSSIRVFGEFLKLGRVTEHEKVCEYGEYIETESRRLTQLINNILDFSKIESERKSYHFELANVADLIRETLKTFDMQLKQQGFTVVFSEPAAALPSALIDAEAIAQAFVNLLDNAVKYSGSSKEIEVRLTRQNSYVNVSVTDHGIGIPREERAKIFEKFYRVSTGLVHDVKGSGLGLSLVKHIVKAHRGRVTVESEPGRGSTFTISLPVAATAGERAADFLPESASRNDALPGLEPGTQLKSN